MKKFVSVFLFLLFVVFFPQQSFAFLTRGSQSVLGTSTVAMPPTAEGPGIFLPGDPLFFLDELKQQIRLFFAPTHQLKAQVHMAIAGERFAELRYMLERNNQAGIDLDLREFEDHITATANELTQAKFDGNNIQVLAKQLNDNLTEKAKVFILLQSNAQGTLWTKFALANDTILAAKEKIEGGLAPDQASIAIQDDLRMQAVLHSLMIGNNATQLLMTLKDLQDATSDAAQKSLSSQQQALQKAIAAKDTKSQQQIQFSITTQEQKQNDEYKQLQNEIQQVQSIIDSAAQTTKGLQ